MQKQWYPQLTIYYHMFQFKEDLHISISMFSQLQIELLTIQRPGLRNTSIYSCVNLLPEVHALVSIASFHAA